MLRLKRLYADDRAIEGLPIRLVIALVVGVASLSVMMNMLSGLQGLAVSELDARPAPEVMASTSQPVEITVVDPSGNRIADATVVIKSKTATLERIRTARTDANGTATLSLDPSLRPNQASGTLEIVIKPPAGSPYVDNRGNTEILVVDG